MELATAKQLAIAELQPMATTVAAYTTTLDSIEIDGEESLATVGDLAKFLSNAKLKLEDKRRSLVDPLNKVVKDINSLFKPTKDSIEALLHDAKTKMDRYQTVQRAIKDAEAAVIREEAAAEEAAAQELAERLRTAAGEEAEPTAAAVIEVAEKNVEAAAAKPKMKIARGETSSVSSREDWTAYVVDLKLLALAVGEGRLPLECIKPSQSALNKVSRETKENREVDGVKFFAKTTSIVK